jgi:hypothetical protein
VLHETPNGISHLIQFHTTHLLLLLLAACSACSRRLLLLLAACSCCAGCLLLVTLGFLCLISSQLSLPGCQLSI